MFVNFSGHEDGKQYTANAACDYISQVAWQTKTFRQFSLHRQTYQAVRESFGLAAQLAVRCIAKVADAYKLDRKTLRTFQPQGAIPYDDRILSYNLKSSHVSIWTLGGRQSIRFVCGPRQRELLASQRGESDLALVRGKWYLFVTCEVETPQPIDAEGALGVDLGIVSWRPTAMVNRSRASISNVVTNGMPGVVRRSRRSGQGRPSAI
jgi:putative transposase